MHQESTVNPSNLNPAISHHKTPMEFFLNLKEEFLSDLIKKDRSQNTIKNYRTDLDCFQEYLQEFCPERGLLDFELGPVLEYGKYLQKKYTSDNSRRRRVQTLRIFFDYLVSKGMFSTNPVRKIPTSPKFLDIPRPSSFAEIKTLWHALLDEEKIATQPLPRLMALRNQTIFLLIYGAGLKVSDLAPMQVDDLILSGETPRVMVRPLRRDPYSIPLPEQFTETYKRYLSLLKVMKNQFQLSFDNLLFNANPYKILRGGLSPRGLEIIFEEYRDKLLIQMTPKSLRQSTIMKWINQGNPDSVIKEWLGVAPSYDMAQYKIRSNQFNYDDETLVSIQKEYLH